MMATGPAPYTRHEDADEDARCPSCGRYNMDDALFCDQCGTRLPESAFPDGRSLYSRDPGEDVQCPSCGKYNEGDARYCDQCGARLPASAYAAVSRSDAWSAVLARFNQNHAAAGSPAGGQFTSSGSSGGSGAKTSAGKAATAQPAPAAARAARKKQLLAQAASDRVQIRQLEAQLRAAQAQLKQHRQAANKAAAAAKAAAPAGKKPAAAAKAAASGKASPVHKKARVTHRRVNKAKAHIAHLQHEIRVLTVQARADEAEAAKL